MVRIPAVLHIDSSARVQTLQRDQDLRLYGALSEFYRRTGVPMLCNTSLNDKGEPIINTVPEAINFAIRKGISVGYFMGRRVQFALGRTAGYTDAPLPRMWGPFATPSLEELEAACEAINPHGLDPTYLYLYLTVPDLRNGVNLHDANAVSRLRDILDAAFAANPSMLRNIKEYLARVWSLHRPPCREFEHHRWTKLI